MASEAGFHVTVVDPRSAFATRERFPTADEVIVGWPNEALEAAELGPHSYIVMLLHDEKFDVPALVPALRSEAGYIGVMGSRRTHERRIEQLREQGCDNDALARLRAPIGLDLGGREPAEIAVSILAEMLAVRHGRDTRGPYAPATSLGAGSGAFEGDCVSGAGAVPPRPHPGRARCAALAHPPALGFLFCGGPARFPRVLSEAAPRPRRDRQPDRSPSRAPPPIPSPLAGEG